MTTSGRLIARTILVIASTGSLALGTFFLTSAPYLRGYGIAIIAVGAALVAQTAVRMFLLAEPGAGNNGVVYRYPPVRLDVPYPEKLSRLALFYKWIAAIPHEVGLIFARLYLVLGSLVVFWVILITGRYPRRMFDSIKWVLEYEFKVLAYYPLLLSDKWSGDDVHLDRDQG